MGDSDGRMDWTGRRMGVLFGGSGRLLGRFRRAGHGDRADDPALVVGDHGEGHFHVEVSPDAVGGLGQGGAAGIAGAAFGYGEVIALPVAGRRRSGMMRVEALVEGPRR